MLAELLGIVRTGSRGDVVAFLRAAGWSQDEVAALLFQRSLAPHTSACRGCGVDTSRRGPGRPRVWCGAEECMRLKRKLKWMTEAA